MRYLFIICISVVFLSGAMAQDKIDSNGALKIIGKSKKVLVPDLANFTFSFDVKDKTQTIAQSKLIKETNKLIDKLQRMGYNKNDIKFLSFNVEDDFEYSGDKPKRIGSTAKSEIELAINYDPIKISEFIDSIGSSNFSYLEYTFNLEVSESLKNSTRDILIKNAIDNARQSAKVISESANIQLGEIKNIEYRDLVFNFSSHGDLLPPPPPSPDMLEIRTSDTRLRFENITLKDTEVYEEVVVTWNIKNTH